MRQAEDRREKGAATMQDEKAAKPPIPRWLHYVLISDRAGSAWYVGTGFFFAPVLAVLSPWPAVTTVLWVLIAMAGLWLGLLGIAMAARHPVTLCCPLYAVPSHSCSRPGEGEQLLAFAMG
jgi:hypothetical protein